jgi:tRNA-modifying protein YgfZ
MQEGGTYTDRMAIAPTVARLDRGYVRVRGPDAEDYLERMLSNEVATLPVGQEARPALVLTPKGRIVAPLRIVRESADAFLLLIDAVELAEPVARTLLGSRFAAKCEVEVLPWEGYLHLGAEPGTAAVRNRDYGADAWETWAEPGASVTVADAAELESLRIEAGTPAWGKELDESILPAEAGLDETHISFTKGCFPGQEPVARLHYRGHPNRRLRVLEIDGAESGDELILDGKVVGRVTSAVGGLALAYVRAEVAPNAVLEVGSGKRAIIRE